MCQIIWDLTCRLPSWLKGLSKKKHNTYGVQLYLSTCSDSSVVSSFNERCQDSNNRSRSQDFEYWNREYQRYGERGKEGRQVYDGISYAACTDQEMRDRNNCLLKHMDRRQKKYRRPRYSRWIAIHANYCSL